MITLYVIASILAYAFVGAFSAAKHHAIESRKCKFGPEQCFKGSWCGHACTSVWVAGVAWPIGLPIFAGVRAGSGGTGISRTERRREREIEEASHKVRLAEIRAQETEALEKALEK